MRRNSIRGLVLFLVIDILISGCSNLKPIDTASEEILDGRFDLDQAGFVRTWLVTEPQIRPHYEGRSESGAMPVKKVKWFTDLAEQIAINSPGPTGSPWRYHQVGENYCMERGNRVYQPSAAHMYTATDLIAEAEMEVEACLWISGWVDIWLNKTHLDKYHGRPITIPLKLCKGRNRFVAHIQNGGLRGVLLKIGLQIPDAVGRLKVVLPGPKEATADIERAENWIRALKVVGRTRMTAATAPPFPVKVTIDDTSKVWSADQREFALPNDEIFDFDVELKVQEQVLSRHFEIPINRSIEKPDPDRSLTEHRQEITKKLLTLAPPAGKLNQPSQLYLVKGIARKTLGQPPVENVETCAEALHKIDKHIAGADFDMAMAMRFYCLGAGTERDREQIKKVALGFRYWDDEPGEDNLCFHSENHRVLFHSAQLISGRLWPDEVFTNSGKTGREQVDLARPRILKWLEAIEHHGFEEFLSSTYIPITLGPVLNLVDFAGDPDISQRASRIADRIYEIMAMHSFDGLTIGPMGRTYRDVIYSHSSNTQGVFSYATPRAVPAVNPWVAFVASSPSYHPPHGLERLMQNPVRLEYREWDYLINLVKTNDYMLSSMEIPTAGKDPSFRSRRLQPGGAGYQQHVWHAMLARDCHVFTNCPGASNALSKMRPGFWYGNKSIPRQTQRGNMLLQIHSIPDRSPIKFTHAYWPSDVFDRQHRRGNWIFGQKNSGYIALWCSTRPEFYSEVLTDRELRAWGDKMAWVCVCSSERESGDLESFISSCLSLKPKFDPDKLSLHVVGQEPTYWKTGR